MMPRFRFFAASSAGVLVLLRERQKRNAKNTKPSVGWGVEAGPWSGAGVRTSTMSLYFSRHQTIYNKQEWSYCTRKSTYELA